MAFMTWNRTLVAVAAVVALIVVPALLAWWTKSLFSGSTRDISPDLAKEGFVFDGCGPLSDARVRVKGHERFTLTNKNGFFRLDEPAAAGDRITAWKGGFFIGSTQVDAHSNSLNLKPLPQIDNEDYKWVSPTPNEKDPGRCGNCHRDIFDEWSSGGHARSAIGRHFRNLFEGSDWNGKADVGWSLMRDHPDGMGVCASCHAPTFDLGPTSDLKYRVGLGDLRGALGVDSQGVHCDYCHKIKEVGTGQFGFTHGRFNLDLLRPVQGQIFFGPLDDVDRGEDSFATLYLESRFCASCHEGTVFGVPVYTTYSEWLETPAAKEGKQCQTCHMKPTGKLTNIAPGQGGIERDPKTLANHRFFADSKEAMLAASIKVDCQIYHAGEKTEVKVSVKADDVGHRVPTGFVDRHLLLWVEGRDLAGKAIKALSGPQIPAFADKDWGGESGKLFAKLLRDFDGRSPVPFWRADPQAVDTRLTPGKEDISEFSFPPGLHRVRVKILYRPFWQQVAVEKGWPDDEILIKDVAFP